MLQELRQAAEEKLALVVRARATHSAAELLLARPQLTMHAPPCPACLPQQEIRPTLLRQMEQHGSADPECRRAFEENAATINEANAVLPRIQAMIARLEHVQRVGYVSNDGFSAPHRMVHDGSATRRLPPLRK